MEKAISKNTFFGLYKLSLLVFFLNSMHPWFLLGVPPVLISLYFFCVTAYASTKGYFKIGDNGYAILMCSLMYLWIARKSNFFGITEAVINAYIVGTLICLNRFLLIECLKFITKWLSIIVGISALFYIIFLVGISLPHFETPLGETSRKASLDNYYFFVVVPGLFGFTRFYSIFLEPGYLTLGVAPILFLYKYNIKNKYILILLFGQLLSFSLAGIFLLFFGFFYVLICGKTKGKVKKICSAFLFIGVLFAFAYNYLGEDYLDQTIFRRIQFVDGKLSGDDRSSVYLDSQYDKLMESDDYLVGMDFDVTLSEKGVSGYKLFVVENGFIGLILVVAAYLSLISIKNFRLNLSMGTIILCLLLLYQNSYPWAVCVLFPAICAKYAFKNDVAEYLKS